MLSRSITNIKGIGSAKAALLREEAGIEDIEDLLYYIPRRYIDRSSFKKIVDCFVNEVVTVRGEIIDIRMIGGTGGRKRLEVTINDGSDSLTGVFFAQTQYFAKVFKENDDVIFSGKINFFKQKQIVHPDFDFIESGLNTGRIVPLYRSTEKLKAAHLDSRGFRRIIKEAIDTGLTGIKDNLPQELINRLALMPLNDAIRGIHFPENAAHAENARKRLAFNEVFFLLFYLNLSREYIRQQQSRQAVRYESTLCQNFIKQLPFRLTDGQNQAIKEINADISSAFPMNRLLQGDVGAGKTVVALATAMLPLSAGRQAALMAPTELLAKQHFMTVQKFIPSSVKAALLTGSLNSSEKEEIYTGLKNGSIGFIVGTHALIQSGVFFKDLSYIIIDEQHRFGVEQRSRLRGKGEKTDLLIMSATPIPRSLSMTIFGDLDISSIRHKPEERQPVKTLAMPESRLQGVYNSMEKYIRQGRQVFYVLPLIEDSEKLDIKSAIAVHKKLSEGPFAHRRLALLHGKLKQDEKDDIMRRFAAAEIDILVTTTVIEVGIDIPNATVIVIEHSERFGLSQLHQLRGRVGRGSLAAFCVLIYPDDVSAEGKKRLEVLVSTNDGFVISEEDLKLRGSGQLTGIKQHGISEFEFTDLINDMDIISAARDEARNAASDITDIEEALKGCRDASGSLVKGIRGKRILNILS